MNLSFHGAAREVTGSCHLLRVRDVDGHERSFLIDCGMFQGGLDGEERNRESFGFDPKEISAVFVTHPHVDHTGRLPKLVKEGFRGKVYMMQPCVGLARLVLEDAHMIMEENAKRMGASVLYSLDDMLTALDMFEGVGYHEEIEPYPGIKIVFHDAGHILGSAFISVRAEGQTIVFSGDLGNENVPILPDTEPIRHADVVVCESTYGHRIHESREERRAHVKQALVDTIKNRSVLMIPAFSIERTQELLYEINLILRDELQTKIPIFLDSPMAIKATQLYRDNKNYLHFDADILKEADRDFFSFPNLRETLRVDESKQINYDPPPKVIIAGSGMMTGGRIMHHLIRYLPDPNNRLLIIGYVAKGTVGRQLYEGADHIQIFGEEVKVKAKITALGSFSAHADQTKMTRWVMPEDGMKPQKIFLVHGDPEAKEVFATHLRHNIGCDVLVPKLHESFEL